MNSQIKLPFNQKPPTILHLDLNSCFATIEQQANPKLRGKPIAVAAYTSPSGCIIAPSIEAKKLGIKVGMRVKDGRLICPSLIVLSPDLMKYRHIHLKLKKLLQEYTDKVVPKSIDEFVLDLYGYPAYQKGMVNIAGEIKERIKSEIGEWLRVSVGIAPNRFLAKTAAGLYKPDGLELIDKNNFSQVYSRLQLTDLSGIKIKNAIRLNSFDIFSVKDFYQAPVWKLKSAFEAITGYYWYLRLRGWEIDEVEFKRKSFGNSFALPQPLSQLSELAPILQKLTEKAGLRMRRAGYSAKGVYLSVVYRDGDFWHRGLTLPEYVFDSRDFYKTAVYLLTSIPFRKPVRELTVSCFNLKKNTGQQLSLLEDFLKKTELVRAIDTLNDKWGNFVITPGRILGMGDIVIDRVAFGGVKELEEAILS